MQNLSQTRLDFQDLPWETLESGIRQKQISQGNQQLRLIEFTTNMEEGEWCVKGHIGYVLMGEMIIHFEDYSEAYKKGDGLWLPQGTRHKICIENGLKVKLILFEDITL